MFIGLGGSYDSFGMTLDSGWDCTGDKLEFLKAMDRLRCDLHRIPTLVEGFRVALSLGWVKCPPEPEPPPPASAQYAGRFYRMDVPEDPEELGRLVLSFLVTHSSLSTSEVIDIG